MVYLLNMVIFYSLIATSMLNYQRVPFRTGLKIATGRFHDPNQWGETAEAPPVLPLGSRRTFAWHRSTFCAPKIEWSMQVNNQQSNNIFTSLHICYFFWAFNAIQNYRTTNLHEFCWSPKKATAFCRSNPTSWRRRLGALKLLPIPGRYRGEIPQAAQPVRFNGEFLQWCIY
jgi:hypothetical protein